MALRIVGRLHQRRLLRLKSEVITYRGEDGSKLSGGAAETYDDKVVHSPSLVCAISVSKCSLFIYYSVCFTPVFLFYFSTSI